MPIIKFLDSPLADDFAGHQVVPMLFYPLNPSAMTDGDQPGVLQPFRGDTAGNLLVNIGASGGGPITIGDDSDDVTPVASDRVPTVARLYGFDPVSGEFDRIRTDDDALNPSDAESEPAMRTMGRNRLFNNFDATWYLETGQGAAELLASAARTATTTSPTIVNANWRAIHFILDVTAVPGGDSITFEFQGRDLSTLAWYPILTGAALLTTGTRVYKVGIGFTPVADFTANDLIPYISRVVITHSGAGSFTYSLAYNASV